MSLIIGVFFIYAALAVIAWLLLLGPQPENLFTRKDKVHSDSAPPESGIGVRVTEAITKLLRERNYSNVLANVLEQAGLKVKPAEFIIFAAVGTVVAAIAMSVLVHPFLGFVAAIASPFITKLILGFLAGRRRTKFANQLDETLQLMAGGLRAGHSLLRAIDAAGDESDAPTSEEFSRIINETRLGRDLGDALDDASHRMRSIDFSWVAQAIAIHREVGGNLADVLDQVGRTIRERNQVRGQVKALSAEGKISALILMALPFVLSGILLVISPGYMNPMFEHPLGLVMIAVSAVMLVLGGLWLKKIVSFTF
jgi:tight adherence protein B